MLTTLPLDVWRLTWPAFNMSGTVPNGSLVSLAIVHSLPAIEKQVTSIAGAVHTREDNYQI